MSTYILNKLCKNSSDYIFSFTGSSRSRSDAFSIAIATVLVRGLTTVYQQNANKPVSDGIEGNTIEATLRLKIVEAMTELNELIRIDIDKVLSYVIKFYQYRCSQLNWSGWANLITCEDYAVVDFFGITKSFSTEDLLIIKEHGVSINTDTMKLTLLFTELGVFNAR